MTTIFTSSFQCSVCMETCDLNHVVTCRDGHVTCTTCVSQGMQSAFSEARIFTCPSHDGQERCTQRFTEVALFRALTPELKAQYDQMERDLAYMSARHDLGVTGDGEQTTYESKCPLCAGVILMDARTVICTKFNEAVRIKCCFCRQEYCRKCSNPWHEGVCDPVSRQDEAYIKGWAITCLCGLRIVRGDGCNKLSCAVCMRKWCYYCGFYFKPHESNYTDHYWQPSDRLPDKSLCPLYGERPEDKKLLPPPAPPRLRGRGIAAVEPVPDLVDMFRLTEPRQIPAGTAVGPNGIVEGNERGEAPEYVPIVVPAVTKKKPRKAAAPAAKEIVLCGFVTARGHPCRRRGLNLGPCGMHRKK